MLKRLGNSPWAYIVPITDGQPDGKHWLVGGEKEGRRGADTKAYGIEGHRDSAGGCEKQVPLDAHVAVGVAGAAKDLTWRGQ